MPSLIRFFGTSAAVPSIRRGFACIGLVSQANSENEEILLLDCGDGSIRKIMETNTNCLGISSILITHFHSDHLSGLAQIIESMAINRRKKDLSVYGPRGLKNYYTIVQETTNFAFKRNFEIKVHELETGQKILLGENKVTTIAMQHTIPCLGYRLESPDFLLAYTGDTEPCNGAISLAQNADLLIHEATYLEKDKIKARESKHSTPREACETSNKARGVRKIILTHVNDKLETEQEMLEEAGKFHSDVRVAHDGMEVSP